MAHLEACNTPPTKTGGFPTLLSRFPPAKLLFFAFGSTFNPRTLETRKHAKPQSIPKHPSGLWVRLELAAVRGLRRLPVVPAGLRAWKGLGSGLLGF